jgi:hypothetical protein
MESVYVGVDVAFAKGKRLPIVICRWQKDRLIPFPLRGFDILPPVGWGNVATIDQVSVNEFAQQAREYIEKVCQRLNVIPARIGIDAPASPTKPGHKRRLSEQALDKAGISCFATPTLEGFQKIHEKVRKHLSDGKPVNRLPHANQLWMWVGFALFEELSGIAECIEVFPQATIKALGVADQHKSKAGAVKRQLARASQMTGWPGSSSSEPKLSEIAFAPPHDCLDAYLSAWVAALDEADRAAYGSPPDDAIWIPNIDQGCLNPLPAEEQQPVPRREKERLPQSAEGHQQICPACGQHTFKRWPFGWDAHAGFKCPAVQGNSPEERKAWFKAQFRCLFKN